ncbi:P-loop NTPase [uncultured Roseibium sp.]|uniref:nucleotide-binding protein n=1 Tax=uncultured Roseibium sp. TaxID=1936171 RepID=UPI002629608B|nr:P-loop NTPase [uncultured Roseibium sp.]
MVKTVHLVMQGKGGAGKSLTSSMLVQYLRYADHSVQAIDLDPTTPTLSAIKGLKALPIQIMDGDDIDTPPLLRSLTVLPRFRRRGK